MATLTTSDEFSLSEAREQFANIVNKVLYAGKRAILTRKGKKVVAIVSLDDLEVLQALEDEMDIKAAKKALADVKKRGTISLAALKRKHKLQ